jgi:hypothetical protein
MPSLLEQIPDITGITDLAAGESGKLSTITQSLSNFPFDDIQSLVGDIGGVSLPDIVPLLDQFPTNLGELTSRIVSDPSSLLGGLGSALGDIQNMFGDQFLGQITPILEQLGPLKNLTAMETLFTQPIAQFSPIFEQLTDFDAFRSQDPMQLLNTLSGTLDAFPSLSELPYVGDLKTLLNTLTTWGDFTPERLGSFVGDALGRLHSDFGALSEGVQAELNRLQSAATVPSMEAIGAELQQIQAQLTTLQGVDFSQADQLAAATAAAEQLQAALNNYASLLTGAIDQVANSLQAFNPGTLLDKLYDLYFALQEAVGLGKTENPVEMLLNSVGQMIEQIDDEDILTPIRETLNHVTGFLDQINLDQLQEPILQAAEQITQAADELERLQTEVVLTIKGLFDEVRGAIDAIDTEAIKQAFQDLLQTFDQQLGPLREALNTLAGSVGSLIETLGQSLDGVDLDALLYDLQEALGQVQSLLQDPEVTSALDTITSNLEEMTAELEAISFAPVFDEVLAQIADMRQDLSEIDVSSLNQMLRTALKAALEGVKAVDFQGDITDPLIEEFNVVAEVPQQLLEEVTSSFNVLLARIEALKPSLLIGGVLEEPIEALKAGMASIKPSQALAPIQEQYDAFLVTLEDLAPSQLLAPLDEFRQELVSVIESVSSLDILAPLEALLDQFRELINSIDLDAWMAELQEYTSKASSLFGDFPLTGVLSNIANAEIKLAELVTGLDPDAIANSLLGVINPVLDLFDQVDLGPIVTAAANLTNQLDQMQVSQFSQTLDSGFTALGSALDQLNVTDTVTSLSANWRAVRDALAAVTPPPELQAQYAALSALIEATNPATILTPVATSVTDVRTGLDALQEETTGAVQSLTEPFDQAVSDLREMFPQQISATFLKDTIRQAISDAFLEPLKKLIRTVKDKTQVLTELLQSVESGIEKLRNVVKVILNPLSMLEPITTAVDNLKQKLLAFNFSFLQEEIQASVQAVADKINELDLTELLAPLDAIFQSFIDDLRSLFSEELVAGLDQLYDEKIGSVVQGFELEDLLAPVDGVYQGVLVALEPLSVEVLLKPLQDKMDALSGELTSGFQRTGQAFEQMLSAIPV